MSNAISDDLDNVISITRHGLAYEPVNAIIY